MFYRIRSWWQSPLVPFSDKRYIGDYSNCEKFSGIMLPEQSCFEWCSTETPTRLFDTDEQHHNHEMLTKHSGREWWFYGSFHTILSTQHLLFSGPLRSAVKISRFCWAFKRYCRRSHSHSKVVFVFRVLRSRSDFPAISGQHVEILQLHLLVWLRPRLKLILSSLSQVPSAKSCSHELIFESIGPTAGSPLQLLPLHSSSLENMSTVSFPLVDL